MTAAEKWKAKAEQVYAHIYLDVPAGHHLHETNVATLKAALAAAYEAGREEERREEWLRQEQIVTDERLRARGASHD